jgi:low temperature requirement protein LtrA
MVGFLIIAMIWWIYFDSLNLLIENKRDKYGTGIIYSQLLVYMSFAILAHTIKHAILNDLNLVDFRVMGLFRECYFYTLGNKRRMQSMYQNIASTG